VSGSFALICLLLLGPQTAAPATPDPLTGDRAAARAVLNDVLSQRAFAAARGARWSSELRHRLEHWFADVWVRLVGNRLGRPSVARALAWVASAAAIFVLMLWLWRAGRRTRRADALHLETPVADERGWRALAQQAVALIRAGRTRDGARLAYRAAVERLEEDGAFTRDATRTPREYLRLIPAQHRRRPALSMLTSAFERIWYGSRVAGDEEREIVTLLQELECLPREQAN